MQKSSSLLATVCLVLGAIVVFTRCASIMGGGTNQDVQISSTPAAAAVKVERSGVLNKVEPVWSGMTPATVNLARKYEYLVTISLDGYKPMEVALEQGTNGWVWGNLICGGLIGLIVDFSNGAAKKLVPGEINVQLVTTTAMGRPGVEESIYAVISTLDKNGELRFLPVPLIPDGNFVAQR